MTTQRMIEAMRGTCSQTGRKNSCPQMTQMNADENIKNDQA